MYAWGGLGPVRPPPQVTGSPAQASRSLQAPAPPACWSGLQCCAAGGGGELQPCSGRGTAAHCAFGCLPTSSCDAVVGEWGELLGLFLPWASRAPKKAWELGRRYPHL